MLKVNCKYYIYALIDPRSNLVRYIGATNNIQRRMFEHNRDRSDTYKARWIRSLKSNKLEFVYKIIKEVKDCENVSKFEKQFIKKFKHERLTNLTIGGDGCSGFLPEAIKKRNAGVRRAARNPERLRKITEAVNKMWADPQFRINHKNIMKPIFESKEYRDKISSASKKQWKNNRNVMLNAINKSKSQVSNSVKILWKNPEYRNKMMRHRSSKEFKKAVSRKVIRSDGVCFDSIRQAAKKIDVDPSSISHCIAGDYSTVGGYTWSYYREMK